MAEYYILPQLQSPIHPPLPPHEQQRVDDVLRDVTDIRQLTSAHIKSIQSIIGARAVLRRPQVSPLYYAIAMPDLPLGVEFDSMIRCLVVKPRNVLRDIITGVVHQWMQGLAPYVRDPRRATASKHQELWLGSYYARSTRDIECSIHPARPTWPVADDGPIITFELGINEATKSLLQGVMRLFRGHCPHLKLAIILNVKELYDRSKDGPPSLGTGNSSSITKLERLDSNVFEAVIYLVYRKLPPQHVWRCVFGSEKIYSRDPHSLSIPLRRINRDPPRNSRGTHCILHRHDNEVEIPFPVDEIIKELQRRVRYDDSKYLSNW